MANPINNRVFYACQAVAITKMGHSPNDAGIGTHVAVMKGVQSVGITTNFTLVVCSTSTSFGIRPYTSSGTTSFPYPFVPMTLNPP